MAERKILLPTDFNLEETEWAKHLFETRPTKHEELIYGKTMGTISNAPQPVLTVDKIRESLTSLKEQMKGWERPTIPRIHVSDLALKTSNKPKRIHVRRWYHTKGYHLRKQKELNDKYGFVAVPSAFYVNPSVQYESGFWSSHHQEPYFVVHPKLYEELKAQLGAHGIVNLETLVNKF
jgi:hypothetical protein